MAPTLLVRWPDSCSRYVIRSKLAPRSKSKLRCNDNVTVQIGLLPRDNEEQVPFAYRLYKRRDKVGCQLAAGYKQTFCTPITIDFVGVWYAPPALPIPVPVSTLTKYRDTVASVGLLYGRNLPFTTNNEAVRVFRHALSLDEVRVDLLLPLISGCSTVCFSIVLDSSPICSIVKFPTNGLPRRIRRTPVVQTHRIHNHPQRGPASNHRGQS